MKKILFQNENIKIIRCEQEFARDDGYYLRYDKYLLPLKIESKLTTKQAQRLAQVIEPTLERLLCVVFTDALFVGKERGKKDLQDDIKKLLGIEA